MESENQRAVFVVVRRVVFAGLSLLGAWLLLLLLRQMATEPLRVASGADLNNWSVSWFFGRPLNELISPRLGPMLQLMFLSGLVSLIFASLLLFLGSVISRLTPRPAWLARTRTILRLVLVSSGVTLPVFVSAILFVYLYLVLGLQPSGGSFSAALVMHVLLVAFLPTWLLVQSAHGDMVNLKGQTNLAVHVGLRMVSRLFRLAGAILASVILVGVAASGPGLGRLLVEGVISWDAPLLLATVWIMVVIVVLARLVADLIEILHNRFSRPSELAPESDPASTARLPSGLAAVCLGLVMLVFAVAFISPSLGAPRSV